MSTKAILALLAGGLVAGWTLAGCGGKADRPPATTSGPPPSTPSPESERPPPPPPPAPEEDMMDEESLAALGDPDNIYTRTLEEINADPPLEDVPFDFDSAVLRDEARATLDRHAEWLKRYPDVTILIEGHCDERGTVEYNLALGERRADAVFNYLVSLGISSDRLKTISYGKEFPLDPRHNEEAWARNRRAHFELTAK